MLGGYVLRKPVQRLAALLLAGVLVFAIVPSAYAVTSAEKMAEAQQIKQQVDALQVKVSVAQENYAQAAAKHDQLVVETKEAAARVAKAEARVKELQGHLNTVANSMYRQGPTAFIAVLLEAESFESFSATWDLLRQVNDETAENVAETKAARAEATAAHKELAAKEKAAANEVAVMADSKASAEQDLAKTQQLLAGVEAEVAQLQAQEAAERARQFAARQAAAQAAARQAALKAGSVSSVGGSARGQQVVAIAKQYLGAPYKWGAAGPSTFDCSGFTMFVYAKVGVSLPHYSAAQIKYGERVSFANLQPGDLVFFGSPIHHVGIYVGGGMMIDAPHTGAVVRIEPIFSSYSGACRP
ncbi:MAG: NlpC/P60 family protein [Coriobacteriia bacterium]